MKAFEIRDLALEELENRIVDEQENLMNLRLQLRQRNLDNPLNYRQARRDLARMKTVLNEKKRAEAAEKKS